MYQYDSIISQIEELIDLSKKTIKAELGFFSTHSFFHFPKKSILVKIFPINFILEFVKIGL